MGISTVEMMLLWPLPKPKIAQAKGTYTTEEALCTYIAVVHVVTCISLIFSSPSPGAGFMFLDVWVYSVHMSPHGSTLTDKMSVALENYKHAEDGRHELQFVVGYHAWV